MPTSPSHRAPVLIGLDWGTSSLRAYLFDTDGVVLDQRAGDLGIMAIQGGAFRAAFESLCAPWLAAAPALPVLASGMIGSRQGWREAPYASAPVSFADIAAGLTPLDDAAGRSFRLVPGVQYRVTEPRAADGGAGTPGGESEAAGSEVGGFDVMRGEETQVFGALALATAQPPPALSPSQHGAADEVFVLPGTHSKWVTVRDARITGLRTYLTGETFAVLSAHSILGRLFDTSADPGASPLDTPAADAAFAAGVRQGHAQPAALLHLLFRVRTEGLFGRLSPSAAHAYLSGLLTGAEIADAHAWQASAATPVLIGAADQTQRYARALHCLHRSARIAPAQCTAAGLYAIARAGGLLANPAL